MSSDKKCCVSGCFEAGGTSHPVRLHVFPNPTKEPQRFEAWRLFVGGHILELTNEHIYKYRRVCHAHFEEKFHCRYNRLSNIAIPTLTLADVHRRNIETVKENIPEEQSALPGVSEVSRPRKRPFTSIQNIDVCLPSTSKEFDRNVLEGNKCMEENSHSAVPSVTVKQPHCTTGGAKDLSYTKTVKKQSLTLAEKELKKKLVAAKIKLSKCKTKLKKQAAAIKIAKNIIKNPSTQKTLESLPKSGRILTMLQLRELKKKDKGRRFTYEEKLVALSLLKQSPKGYRLLRKMIILPAPQTLIKLISNANIQAGINKNIFSQMKKQAEKMNATEKLCILLFDEMSLDADTTWNERIDRVVGLVDNGEIVTKEYADHAQVFMIRGLINNYKQPIGYTYSRSATKGPELAKQIKEYVREITKAGLTVVATICDQGSGNRNAIKYLVEESRATWLRKGEEPKNNIFLVDNSEIIPLYDTPHLIKCIRNNLISKNLKYTKNNETKVAKWSHIELLYDENPAYQGIRLIPKLTENHVKPAKISKMKVKYATQIFSRTVASNMGYLADKQIIPQECKETADILLFFDNLFDSMNGSYNKKYRHAKPALGPVTPNSIHHQIWLDAKNMLRNMRFISNNRESVPTLNNWVWTLDGMETLTNVLETKYGVSSIWMRHLNQDPLENFFGSIRSHGCRNTNPTPERFQAAFAALLINSLSSVHTPGNNCEDDIASSLYALVINEDCEAQRNESVSVDFEIISDIKFTSLEEKFKNQKIKAGLQYCSGYFAKKCKAKIFKKCLDCNKNIIDKNACDYISHREFEKKQWLCSPTTEFIANISEMQDVIYKVLQEKIEIRLLKEFIKTLVLMLIDFDYLKCIIHKEKLIEFLINCVCRFFIHTYCKNINKILRGRRTVDDDEDVMQIKAKMYFDTKYKRKK